MRPLLWLDLVGLTPRMIGPETPHLAALAERGAMSPMSTVLPAVTCSVQASLLTGLAAAGARRGRQRLDGPGDA